MQLEELKLLSKAEKLGLLSLVEKVLSADPGAVTSASIPCLLAAVGNIPDAVYAIMFAPVVSGSLYVISGIDMLLQFEGLRQMLHLGLVGSSAAQSKYLLRVFSNEW